MTYLWLSDNIRSELLRKDLEHSVCFSGLFPTYTIRFLFLFVLFCLILHWRCRGASLKSCFGLQFFISPTYVFWYYLIPEAHLQYLRSLCDSLPDCQFTNVVEPSARVLAALCFCTSVTYGSLCLRSDASLFIFQQPLCRVDRLEVGRQSNLTQSVSDRTGHKRVSCNC